MNREMGKRFLFFAAAALALFSRSLPYPFVNFDDAWIVHNPILGETFSARGLATVLFDWSREARMAHGAEYLPVRDLYASTLYALFGENPLGYRLAAVLLYALSCGLFLEFLLALGVGLEIASGAAILFLVHPLHVEPVAWLSSAKDLLCLAFVLGAVWAYARGRWTVAASAFVLAVFSKYHALFLPLLLPFVDRARGRRIEGRRIAPFFGVAGVAWWIARRVGATVDYGHAPLDDLMPWLVPALAGASVRAFVWPSPLHLLYAIDPEMVLLKGMFGLAVLAGAGLLLWRGKRQRSLGALALAGWLLPLLPMLRAPRMHLFADRYFLIPSLALCALAAAAWGRLRAPILRYGALVAAVGCFAGLQWTQQGVWRDSVALWEHADAHGRGQPIAQKNLAVLYRDRGEWEKSLALYRAFTRGLRRDDDDFVDAWVNRAFVALKAGRAEEARDSARAALGERRTYEGFLNLGAACATLRDFPCARAAFEDAAALRPRDPQPVWNLHVLGRESGDGRLAARALARFRELAPRDPRAQSSSAK